MPVYNLDLYMNPYIFSPEELEHVDYKISEPIQAQLMFSHTIFCFSGRGKAFL